MPHSILKLGVLVSGRGSNLQSILEATANHSIEAEVQIVISNKVGAYALERAKQFKIPTEVVLPQKNEPREAYDKRLVHILKNHGVELVVLAGFMRIISSELIKAFPNHIINIHPSLLPAFPGLHAQKQALDHGVKVAGCTVHVVDEGCDTGPIILQAAVPVQAGDTEETLSQRILGKEHELLPKAIDLFAKNKVKLANRKIITEA